jgi:hypothetical protein
MTDLTQHRAGVEGRWRPRFALAALVRLVAYGLPVVCGSSAAWLVSHELGASSHRVLATVTVLGAAVAVSLLMSRLTMKLMPLAVLLRMTMIFPDRAPSRVKVARLSNSSQDIGQRLHSRSADESEAAMTMLSLVTALGRHDRRTRGHSERVRLFSDLLADQMGLTEADAGRLRWAALIHDIGKLEIPEAILNKPAGLSDEEWALVRRHPLDGARLARPLECWLGEWFAGIAHHHERWDGSGYPMGLTGEKISASGRVIAVVDSFETMTSARAYKAARSTMDARTELALCAGTHFDPTVVRSFLAISLPKLLWSVGPLAFLVNVPYLKWVVEGGVRTADIATAATAAGANAAGATVVAVAVGAMPSSASAVPNLPLPAGTHAHTVATSSGPASATNDPISAPSAPMGTFQLLGDSTPFRTVGPFATAQLPAVEHADPAGPENRPDAPGGSGKHAKDDARGQTTAGNDHGPALTTHHGSTPSSQTRKRSSQTGKGSSQSGSTTSSSDSGSSHSGSSSDDGSSDDGHHRGGSSSGVVQESTSGSSGTASSGRDSSGSSSGKGSSGDGRSSTGGKG